MPTYKVKEEDSFWHGGKVTKVERVTDAQDIFNAAGKGIDFLLTSSQNARYRNLENTIKSAAKFLDNGEFEQAIKCAEELFKTKEQEAYFAGHLIKARAFSASDRYQEAIAEYSALVEIAEASNQLSEIPFIFWERGLRYMIINELGPALKDFTKFIKLKPKEDTGYLFQGVALKELGDFEQALFSINEAIKLNPGNENNYRERGLLYVEMKEVSHAFQDYSRAISLNPKDALLYKTRGDLYILQKEYQQAIVDYSQAIELDPANLKYYKKRVELYRLVGDEVKLQVDISYVNHEESIRSAYAEYLQTAKQLFEEGITETPTESERKLENNQGCAVGTFFFGSLLGIYFLTAAGSGLQLIGLVILLVVGIITISSFGERAAKKKLIRSYSKQIPEKELSHPGFTEFFKLYLESRKEGAMTGFSTKTRSLLESKVLAVTKTPMAGKGN